MRVLCMDEGCVWDRSLFWRECCDVLASKFAGGADVALTLVAGRVAEKEGSVCVL